MCNNNISSRVMAQLHSWLVRYTCIKRFGYELYMKLYELSLHYCSLSFFIQSLKKSMMNNKINKQKTNFNHTQLEFECCKGFFKLYFLKSGFKSLIINLNENPIKIKLNGRSLIGMQLLPR